MAAHLCWQSKTFRGSTLASALGILIASTTCADWMDVRCLRQRRKSQGGVFNCVAPRRSSRNQTRCNPRLVSDAVAPEISFMVSCGTPAALCLVRQSNVAACSQPTQAFWLVSRRDDLLCGVCIDSAQQQQQQQQRRKGALLLFCRPPASSQITAHFAEALRCAMRSLISVGISAMGPIEAVCGLWDGPPLMACKYLVPWLPCSNLFCSCGAVTERGLLLAMSIFFFSFSLLRYVSVDPWRENGTSIKLKLPHGPLTRPPIADCLPAAARTASTYHHITIDSRVFTSIIGCFVPFG